MEDGAHSESHLRCTDLEGDSPIQDSNLVCRLGHVDLLSMTQQACLEKSESCNQ